MQSKNEFQTRFEKFQKFNDDINLGIARITEISKSMRNATRTDKEFSKDVSFIEVCEEAIIITSSKLKNMELIREFSLDFPYLTCNRSQMSQVIMNFLSNSADAIEEYKSKHPEEIVEFLTTLKMPDLDESFDIIWNHEKLNEIINSILKLG